MDALWLAPSAVVLVGTPFVARALVRARVETRRTAVAIRALALDVEASASELGAAGQRLRAAVGAFEARRGGLPPAG